MGIVGGNTAAQAPVERTEPTFRVDRNGFVTADLPQGGHLKSQSVEALLLHAILRTLEGG